MCLTPYANNKGADQPAHLRSLISAFVVRCLDSIISLDSIAEISRLASFCGCAGRFVSCLVGDSQRHIFSWRGSNVILILCCFVVFTFGYFILSSLTFCSRFSSLVRQCDHLTWGRESCTTVNFVNIQTPKTVVVITLKFELCGSTIE